MALKVNVSHHLQHWLLSKRDSRNEEERDHVQLSQDLVLYRPAGLVPIQLDHK